MPKPAVAYLVSEYPALSHTFIFREIASLRDLGLTIRTASICRPEHLDVMAAREKAEAETTLFIKARSPMRILEDAAGLAITRPAGLLRMIGRAARLAWSGRVGSFKALAYFVEAVILVRWMLREGVRHVHVHFANPAATVALIASASGAVSYSLSVHGPDEFFNIEQDMIREKAEGAVFVRCISHYCRSQLLRVSAPGSWDKFHIVHCSVDTNAYQPRPPSSNGTREILCVGRLVPSKGQALLVRACSELRERGVPVRLTLVGAGPDREFLEGLARELGVEESVRFTGPVGQQEIQGYYDCADVFALPSFAEGLPVVLMEAMAKGIPCVSTTITGIPELIEDGVNGLLAPASDQDGLTQRLESILRDDALRERLASRTREKVVAEFDAARNAERMAALFERYVRA